MEVPKKAWKQFLQLDDVKRFREMPYGYRDVGLVDYIDVYLEDHVHKWFKHLTSGVWVPVCFFTISGDDIRDLQGYDVTAEVLNLMEIMNMEGMRGARIHYTTPTGVDRVSSTWTKAMVSTWKKVK